MTFQFRFLAIVALLWLACHPAGALSTNLVPSADCSIRNNAPDSNSGTGQFLAIGVSQNFPVTNNALLRFDLTALPANAQITAATLQVNVAVDPRPPAGFGVHRLLVPWGELAATWNHRLTNVAWTVPGAGHGSDFTAAPSATTVLSIGVHDFTSATLITDVQGWIDDPDSNFGWIILATDQAHGSGKQIASRDTEAPPLLILEYTADEPPPVPPDPPTLSAVAQSGNQFRFSFTAQANHTYAVEARESIASGLWTVITNIPAQPLDTTIDITNAVTFPARFLRVRSPGE